MSDKLGCPHCEAPRRAETLQKQNGMWIVICRWCGCRTREFIHKASAIESWLPPAKED